MSNFGQLKAMLQLITVSLSLVFNILLIYFVITKSSKKLGNYRHLMCYFSAFSMIYAIIDFIVQPYIHSHGASFSMIMDTRGLDWDPFLLVSSLAGCFGVTIYAIAINFIYRFFALERTGRLRYFNWKFLFIWFTIPLLGGASWVFVAWSSMYPEPEFTEYLRKSIKENYGLDADNITYTGAYFYRENANGIIVWDIKNSLGALALNCIMSIPFLTIIIFGYRSYKIVTELMNREGESNYTKQIQMQLYKALVAQTIIPMVFLFFPIGLLFSAPLIHLNMEKASLLVTFFYALYPAVDPLPIIFFIDDYRKAFFGVFCFCSNSPQRNQVVSVSMVSVESNHDGVATERC